MTIEELRKSGNKVKVVHIRKVKHFDQSEFKIKTVDMPATYAKKEHRNGTHRILSRGGLTKVSVTTPEGMEYEAQSVCGRKDGFCYKRGVSVCLGRIEKAMRG